MIEKLKYDDSGVFQSSYIAQFDTQLKDVFHWQNKGGKMQRKKRITENQMAIRILNREDNPIYKQQMIRNILNMYSDEVRKAMLNGESVHISGVGTLIPEVKVHEGKYNMPICNQTEGNPPPYTKIRIYRNPKMERAMNNTLLQNLKNGIFGLKERLFNHRDFEFLKEVGYIPEDAELPTDDE